MGGGNVLQKRKQSLRGKRYTHNEENFARMLEWFDSRPAIIAEGDSWFGYPPPWLLVGEASNLLDWIAKSDRPRFNMLRLEKNGDEAIDMLSGAQKHKINRLLEKYADTIDVFLFSGGGNDIVGEYDMPFLLHDYKDGMTAADCIREERFARKLTSIQNAYLDLIDIRNEHRARCTIITHTYDIPIPSNDKARFLGGLIHVKPWIKPYMDAKKIPPTLQRPIAEILLQRFRDTLLEIQNLPTVERFVVVDTQGTLDPHNKKLWVNEIHPSSDGFGIVAAKLLKAIRTALSPA